ncbi:MAG: hypothetical protein ACQESP_04355 [Candidatus Muiribacteriota bacterium]
MKNRNQIIILLLILFNLYSFAEFEDVQVSVKNLALAGAGSAFLGGAETVHLNPAGLSEIKDSQLYSFQTTAFGVDGLETTFNVIGNHFPGIGGFAVSSLDFGTGNYSENQYSISFARKMVNNTSIGINIKQLRSKIINTDNAKASSFDIGFTGGIGGATEFAVVVKNLNAPTVNDVAHRIFQVGFKYKNSEKSYTVLDFSRVYSYGALKSDTSLRMGKIFRMGNNFEVLCGFSTNPQKITGGFSFEIADKWVIDYAFDTRTYLSPTHAVSFGMKL